MKILMIGLGSIGQRHLRNIKKVYGESFEILAYRTRRLQQTFSDTMQIIEGVCLEDEYGIRVYTSLEEALSEKPDIAYVTNITSKHMETAISCAKAGCHLFIEKPLSNSIDGIKELQRIIADKHLIVFMGFQNRYHPCVQDARRFLAENKIGAVLSVDTEFSERLTTMHSYEDYRETYMAQFAMGGGPVLNLQIHDLDLLHYLFGDPVEVFSILSKNSKLEVDVEDGASSIFTFRNSNEDIFPAYSHTDFLQFPPVHKVKIVGEKGRIEFDMNTASIKLVVEGETVINNTYTDFQRNDMFIAELKDFIDSVKNNKEPIINLEQGIVCLNMALAAKKSSNEGKKTAIKEI